MIYVTDEPPNEGDSGVVCWVCDGELLSQSFTVQGGVVLSRNYDQGDDKWIAHRLSARLHPTQFFIVYGEE